MQPYLNLSGNSAVASFKLAAGEIVVVFNTGASYLYNHGSAGQINIAHMHQLALAGSGLNSFINRVVRKQYAQKLS